MNYKLVELLLFRWKCERRMMEAKEIDRKKN